MLDQETPAQVLLVLRVACAAAELEQTVNAYRQHQDAQQQLEEARVYLKEEAASDPDMAGKWMGCHDAQQQQQQQQQYLLLFEW
ncbi:hypothetical protein COO60DRAFT_1643007 [Scenedesmus sp. NREL 46B-D3]|nr:hypothetical protein COO60DRAFT_1643007 [Scenedesmus sp. NREL 46B-D3]